MRHSRRQRRTGGAPNFVDPVFAEELSNLDRRREPSRRRGNDHKTLQLCRQVQRALSLALAGDCGDEVLRAIYVESVSPAPNASHLLVRLTIPRHAGVSAQDVRQSIERVQGKLRAEMTRAITRKYAPQLTFVPVAEVMLSREEGVRHD